MNLLSKSSVFLCLIALPWRASSFVPPSNRIAQTKVAGSLAPVRSRSRLLAVGAQDTSDGISLSSTGDLLREQAGTIIWLSPPIACIVAFNGYSVTSKIFHETVQFVSNNNWIPVDGGTLLASIITPAVNGPVMTSLSILFGSLSAITISSLYERQNQIRRSLVSEVEEIRNLAVMVQSFPDASRDKANIYLTQIVERVVDDVSLGKVSKSSIRNRNMDRMLHLLNELSSKALTQPEAAISDNILGGCYSGISKMTTHRSNMISALQATFPPLHYVTLAALGSAICFVFLVETDRDVLFFLAAFQLKTLWALMIGIFSLLAVVIYDLNEPFHGTYKIIDIAPADLGGIIDYIIDPLGGD